MSASAVSRQLNIVMSNTAITGVMRTMKANYHNNDGDIRIIRPLSYVRESLTRDYANAADLPIINENCPGNY